MLMNVGLIIYGRLETLTGGYIYDRMLVEHLRRCGHRIDIISLPHRQYPRLLFDNLSNRLFGKLAAADFDLLLQDELNHPSLFRMNYRLRKTTDPPIVAIVHQVRCRQPRSGLLNSLYEIVERTYLKSIDAFIFNSNTSRHSVEQLIAGRRPSLVAFPAGDRLGFLASSAEAESRALSPGPLRLIFVGNVLPNKGLLPLIRGLAKLPFEIWRLTVVGSLAMNRRYIHQVEKSINAFGLKQQVALVGPKDGRELASLLAHSHVYVMPYSHEGFGMAYLEALGFALPVIASTSGAVKEFVIPGQNGFLIDPGDEKTILERIRSLHQDRQRLIKMSRNAMRTFHGRPKWKDTTAAIEGFLNEIYASSKSGTTGRAGG